MNALLWTIPMLPLAGAAINGLLGGRMKQRAVTAIALLFPSLSFAMALAAAVAFARGEVLTADYGAWIHLGPLHADFTLALDALSLAMVLIVTGVGLLIHIYSAGYMHEEAGYARYFSELNLFLFFMLTLAMASNYLLLFAGWEGVGLCSYLLIGFFYREEIAAEAGKKAFLANRIGDLGLLIAMFAMMASFGSLDYATVFAQASTLAPASSLPTMLALLLLLGAMGKSAQFPLHVWLPDAMAGPTPVSALIHAATMVTAGVYLICRSHVLFALSPTALATVAVIGCGTALFAALIALVQTDIKRVLAYSTVSQLGYMFLAAGMTAWSAAIFHLFTHAFFKALLFLAAGSVIHALGGEQDMRKMGGLRRAMPATFWTMTIGCGALAGIPLLSGFFSKDEILFQAFASPHGHWVFWAIGSLTALLTSFYTFRLWMLTFFGERRGLELAHESPRVMTIPLVLLAIGAALAGYLNLPPFMGGSERFSQLLGKVLPPAVSSGGESSGQLAFSAIAGAIAISGLALAWLFTLRSPGLAQRLAERCPAFYMLLRRKFYLDELYDYALRRPLLWFARTVCDEGIEETAIEGGTETGVTAIRFVARKLRHVNSGNLRSYSSWISAGGALLIFYMVWVATR
jgi:NADH-quinone oxidoreductase subunit L